MSKKLVAKVGEYTDGQGNQKSRWQNVGVMLSSNDGGEYILLDPHVSLSAVMQSQNMLAIDKGDKTRDRVMCSIFEDDNQQSAPSNSAPQQSAPGANNKFADTIRAYRGMSADAQQLQWPKYTDEERAAIIKDFDGK